MKSKLAGVLAMFGSILIWFALPWLDRHPVKSGSYRPIFKFVYLGLVVSFLVLGYVGGKPADGVIHFAGMDLPLLRIGQACALYYFGYFVAILPFLSSREKARELPKSIFEHTEKKYKNIK